ncbi:MAG: hypothetical protein H6917_02895 [Novosphingobium sp.]|nr:hypothetical protein [Novosphingobium sp.]MCP5401317.1 hypothetical protein [Novosphingobium sp.]
MNKNPDIQASLSNEDVAIFCSVVGAAPRILVKARETITRRYDLGPRGAWILGLIEVGVTSPSHLSDQLRIGRSLLTAELGRLVRAGLIESRKHDEDRRRLVLSLTASGNAACDELRVDVTKFVNDRLSGYPREDVMRCVDMLREFGGADRQFYKPSEEE